LIDRCVELAKRKEQTNRSLFTDFVAPALADFEVVHKGYVDTFRRYRQMIETSSDFTELKRKLLYEIKVDNLFSASDRAKIWELERWVNDPVIGSFILAIIRYIGFDRNWEPEPEAMEVSSSDIIRDVSQHVRESTGRVVIQSIGQSPPGEEERREAAVEALEDMLYEVQANYAEVMREYSNLKDKLLRPI
jgi:hypothetical protein